MNPNKTNKIDQEFLSEENFDLTMNRIYGKIRERKKILYPKKHFQNVDLNTIIKNKKEFHQTIIEYFKNEEISLSPLKLVELITNKKRNIYIANWAERILLMMAQNTFSKILEKYLSEHTYAFRKGMGPTLAKKNLKEFIKKNKKDLYIYQGDISSYGDSINQEKLSDELSSIKELNGTKLLELIKKSIFTKYIDKEEKINSFRRGIPSGSPLVPVMENFYLKEMDYHFAQNKNSFYARYGDDFIFICQNEIEINKHEIWLKDFLESKSLKVKPEKVKKTYFSNHKKNKSDFHQQNSIEWIGLKFHQNGKTSLKKERYLVLKNVTKNEINQLFLKVKKNIINEDEQLAIIKNGLMEILNPQKSPKIKKFILETNDISVIKQYHHTNIMLVQRLFRKVFSQDGRKAWRNTRKTIPKLENFLKSKQA